MPLAGGDGHEDQELDRLEREEVFGGRGLGCLWHIGTATICNMTLVVHERFGPVRGQTPHPSNQRRTALVGWVRSLTPYEAKYCSYWERKAAIGSTFEARRAGT